MQVKTIVLAAALSVAPGLLRAQFDFNVDGRQVQVHSFASEGFLYSNVNNFLTMETSVGSFSMTDAGANVSTQLTDKFRVGAQLYLRNVGEIGKWHPEFDWALGDYRFKEWFGVRGGKVKTTLGLYNDTQDLEFLHTWALMPQSVYPVDSRGDVIAHVGGNLYGNISLKQGGAMAYTFYGGYRQSDMYSGLIYGVETTSNVNGVYVPATKKIDSYGGPVYGADLRWTTPLKGLLAGASYMSMDITTKGYFLAGNAPYDIYTLKDNTIATYVEYTKGNFTFAGEYRKQPKISLYDSKPGVLSTRAKNSRQGYISAEYRVSKLLTLGTYYSRHYKDWDSTTATR